MGEKLPLSFASTAPADLPLGHKAAFMNDTMSIQTNGS